MGVSSYVASESAVDSQLVKGKWEGCLVPVDVGGWWKKGKRGGSGVVAEIQGRSGDKGAPRASEGSFIPGSRLPSSPLSSSEALCCLPPAPQLIVMPPPSTLPTNIFTTSPSLSLLLRKLHQFLPFFIPALIDYDQSYSCSIFSPSIKFLNILFILLIYSFKYHVYLKIIYKFLRSVKNLWWTNKIRYKIFTNFNLEVLVWNLKICIKFYLV